MEYKMKKGAASVSLIISIATIVAAAIMGGLAAINTAIAPVQAQVNVNTANILQNTSDISTVKEDVVWIRSALENNGFRPSKK